MTVAGLAAGARAAWLAADDRPSIHSQWSTPTCVLLWAMALVGLLTPAREGAEWYDTACRAIFVFGSIGVWFLYAGAATARRRTVAAIVIAYAALQIITPIGIPNPKIDVFVWTQTALGALRSGIHPYLARIPEAAHVGPTAALYPYMPATLIAFFPAFILFGDCRVLSAVAMAAAVILNRTTGRRLGIDPAFLDATTLAFVLHPRSTWITANAWNESLLVFVLAVFTYLAVRRPAGRGQAIAFFLLASLKQYMAAPLLLYLGTTPPRQRLSHIAQAAAIAALTVLPFLLWNWRATLNGIVTQMIAPASPRVDSTSLVAAFAVATGFSASRWLSVGVQFVAAGIAFTYLRRCGLGGVLLASALTLTATFLAGWQAFVNYYYLAAVMFLTAAMVLAANPAARSADLIRGEGARRPCDRRAPR